MKVITVTLNPSLERTFVVHYLAKAYHNQSTETTRLDPAGRGVNISRALHALQAETHAVILLGNDATGIAYQALISQEKFRSSVINVTGQTRSNVVIWDTASKEETTLTEDNAGFSPEQINDVANVLRQLIEPDDFVVFAGPMPANVSDEKYVELINTVRESGAHTVLDIPGEALRAAIEGKPRIVFLTQTQVERYFNFPVRVLDDLIYCAHKLNEEGAERVLILQDENRGILMSTPEETLSLTFPEAKEIGTSSGMVDALLAGFLTARIKAQTFDMAVKLGAAAALYTAEQVGNDFPQSLDLPDYLKQVTVTSLKPSDPLPQ